ncbi:MAG: four-carbon acid sugar kinase family protein [Terracidiphilus sp.]
MPSETFTTSQSAPAQATTASRVCLLADDLTGACDAGAAFLGAGLGVRVWLGERALFAAQEAVQAYNTASRALPAHEAAEAVARATAAMETGEGAILFKKIDSAARGPIAAELQAAQQALGARAILLAPGFPAAGRTVRNGILEISDASGQNATVDLRELFPAPMLEAMVSVCSAGEVAAAIESGKTVLLCDSATQEDLNALARAAQPFAGLLYAGSAGLARAIANLYGTHALPAPRAAASRTLVVAGSAHPVTKLQLEHLEGVAHRHRGLHILRIECEAGDEAKIREAFRSLEPEALILTGGDTALFAGQALGAHSILLQGEFAPGIPWGILEGGVAHGRIAVTKSGGFGSATALNDLIAHLSGAA